MNQRCSCFSKMLIKESYQQSRADKTHHGRKGSDYVPAPLKPINSRPEPNHFTNDIPIFIDTEHPR